MREIKFRAWDKNNKGFINGFNMYGFSVGQGAPTRTLQRFSTRWEEENFVLMQYTGFKDKNGKEIYEGDILAPDSTCRSSDRYIIEWNEENGCFTSIAGGKENYIGDLNDEIRYNMLSNMRLNKCEIIGNIYENPELLEG